MAREGGSRRRLRRPGAAVVVGGLVMAASISVPAASAAPADPAGATATYLVQTELAPVVAYHGGVAGLAATAPARGHKVDTGSADVDSYVAHLKSDHQRILSKIGGGKKLYDYTYAFDGFAARLTADQAAAVAAEPGVVAVTEDRKYDVATTSPASFLGLDAPGGLWDQLGGPEGTKKQPGAGDGIVIGVIDSGITPDAASFSDRDRRGHLVYGPLTDFRGHCDSAETVGDDSWDANLCNRKLIAARHYDAGWGGDPGMQGQRPWEFLSPRDYNGHGTHTASTAAGDSDVIPTGAELMGPISGIAPRARIADYKALWSTEDGSQAQGFDSDIVGAIDQAVADGVDVISFSISGTSTDFLDPVEVAFLYAADAGIFIAAAGGNSGPSSRTVAHPSPWITSVAAGTYDQSPTGSVTLGNGKTYAGPSIATQVPSAPLIDATDAALPDANAYQAQLCYPAAKNGGTPVLDPAKVAGRIVVCDEGDFPEQFKSRAVKEAGGVGMILTHTYTAADANFAVHFVPTIDLPSADRAAVKAYADTAGGTATIARASVDNRVPAPHTASFSSRGPLLAGGGDLLKPDVMAPGVNILAAIAPSGSGGLSLNFESGTSMATPHVAGVAALLAQRHPDWTPMEIKSALTTSAYDVLDGPATDPAVIFSEGGGYVRPNSAADPGLVFNSTGEDWLAFLCGTTNGVDPQECDQLLTSGHSLDPSNLNMPSVAIGRMAGPRTVTRTVTNVGSRTATYTAHVAGLQGVDVTVSPSRLTLAPGASASFTISLVRDTAPPTGYVGGRITWSDGSHQVRMPVVARLVRAPETAWRVDTLAGGPTFDVSTQTGFLQPELPIRPGSTAGDAVGVGAVAKWGSDGQGKRVVRFGPDGWEELGGLGASPAGDLQSYVYATAPDGTAVGNATVWAADGTDLGNRPVRWPAGSTKAVELQGLGTSSSGSSFGAAEVINSAGTVGGDVDKYADDGSYLGRHAVRWDAGQTRVTELGTLGSGPDGSTNTWARAINGSGVIVGSGSKRDAAGFYGSRAIRWDADGTAATELGALGTDASGSTSADAYDINDAGTTVGQAAAYDDGTYQGTVAVRWDSGGTAATELDSLGVSPEGLRISSAYAINSRGLVVGSSTGYSAGASLGERAVAWQPGQTGVTPLEQLEISTTGQARSVAVDINDSEWIVGQAHSYTDESATDSGERAVMWAPDGRLIDLTALLPADSGWTLTRAASISNSGWITAIGLYDADGAGPLTAYQRLVLLHVEPASS